MEGKEVVEVVKRMDEAKENMLQLNEEKIKSKEKQKEDFYRCKTDCVCKKDKCLAVGLKECPSSHCILHSIRSKASCKVNDKKPEMILAAADMHRKKSR